MSTQENKNKRLQELSDSDYEIVHGQPDIRGWNVVDSIGKKVGEVDDLIFDVESRKVRYIVLDLEDNDYKIKNKNVLIPIGLIELHSNDDDVILNKVTTDQLIALPAYHHENLDTELETTILNIIGSTTAPTDTVTDNRSDFYDHEHFNDNLNRNRSTETTFDEHVRMRQEHSLLEREGTNRMNIDDDIDNLHEEKISIDERDAIPASTDSTLRSGNDIDERDRSDEDIAPRTDTDITRNDEERSNRPSGI